MQEVFGKTLAYFMPYSQNIKILTRFVVLLSEFSAFLNGKGVAACIDLVIRVALDP